MAQLGVLSEGVQELYVLTWPPGGETVDGSVVGHCMIIMRREGGLLLGVPASGFLSPADLQLAPDQPEEDAVFGPHTTMTVPAVAFDEEDNMAQAGVDLEVLVVDASLKVLPGLVRFEDAVAGDILFPFSEEDPSFMPDAVQLLKFSKEWIGLAGGAGSGVMNFYSADEGDPVKTPRSKAKSKAKEPSKAAPKRSNPQQVAEHIRQLSLMMPMMQEQLSQIQEEQKRFQEMMDARSTAPPPKASQAPVSMPMQAFAKMMGSPPRAKVASVPLLPVPSTQRGLNPDSRLSPQEQSEEQTQQPQEDSLALAVLEQSRALTSLVSQMQGADPLLDSTSLMTATTSRGSQGREKLQKELAARSGGFFLAVVQNAYRRMRPASRVPASLEEMAATDFSMVQYLERFGGYGNARELGIVQYALSFVVDCALRGDLEGVREHSSLLAVALEQAAQDQNRWELAFQLLLLEDPPPQIWSYRQGGAPHTGRARAFSALCPQRWASVALAYTKEIDYLQNRRQEVSKAKAQPPAQPLQPQPKKKGKFPRGKPKEEQDQEAG